MKHEMTQSQKSMVLKLQQNRLSEQMSLKQADLAFPLEKQILLAKDRC